jgi:hypothetical protein
MTAEAEGPSEPHNVSGSRESVAVEEDLLANIEKLSEEQVNSLLAEMLTKDAVT